MSLRLCQAGSRTTRALSFSFIPCATIDPSFDPLYHESAGSAENFANPAGLQPGPRCHALASNPHPNGGGTARPTRAESVAPGPSPAGLAGSLPPNPGVDGVPLRLLDCWENTLGNLVVPLEPIEVVLLDLAQCGDVHVRLCVEELWQALGDHARLLLLHHHRLLGEDHTLTHRPTSTCLPSR